MFAEVRTGGSVGVGPMWQWPLGIALCVVASVGAWTDIRERRIPNVLTVTGLAVALLLRIPMGFDAVGQGLIGALLTFGLALPFFLVGGLGGGDVKFLTAIGGFLGPRDIWFALLVMSLVGAVMAIWVILRNKAVGQTAVNLRTIFSTFGLKTFSGWKGPDSGAPITIQTEGVLTVPYGVAIAAGAVTAWAVYSARPEWSLTQSLASWLS